MANELPVINIKAQSNHHAVFLMLIAAIVAFTTLAFSQGYWRQFQLPLLFIYLSALVTFITGVAKYLQPQYSLYITPDGIKYQHRYGQWHINWQQIQRISLINETYGLQSIQLPYIGIRLLDLSVVATNISPRLANRLIHEQRPLLALAIKMGYLTMQQSTLSFEPYTLPSGQVLKGPLAAFLHHSAALHSALGYHLFLPESAVDRELSEFCTLLTQCMRSASQYTQVSNSSSFNK